MPQDEVFNSYNLNIIENKKTFDVSAVISAYYFGTKPNFKPVYENYIFSQILLVLDGKGTYTTGNITYPLSPGMMLYRPANKSSIYKWDTDHAGLALISFICRSEAMGTFEGAPIPLCEEESSIFLDVVKTCTRICEPLKETETLRGMRFKDNVPEVVLGFISSSLERFLSMVYCRLRGIELLLDESQKVSSYIDSTRLVSDIKRYFEDNISNQLTIDDICTHFCVSQSSLAKKFRIETGSGLMEYFTQVKVGEAKRRIREGSGSLAEISESLGYTSSSYFSRVFKKHTGMTPTEYSRYASKRRIIK